MDNNQSNIIAKGIVKAVFSLLAVVAILWFLYTIRIVLIYLLIALVVSLIGRPLKRLITKHLKLKDTFASAVSLLLILSLFIIMFAVFVPLIIKQAHNLSALDINGFQQKMNLLLENIKTYLHQRNISVLDDFNLNNVFSQINLKILPELVNSIINIIGNFIVGFFAVSFISFFMLKDNQLTSNFLFKLIPDDDVEQFQQVFTKIKDLLSRYFIGISIQISIIFILYTILLNYLDVENATFIALLAALMNLVPYIGPIVGWIIMISLSLTSQLQIIDVDNMMHLARNISIGYVLIQLWDAFVDVPMIYSKSVKAHPLEIFLVIMIAGTLFGVLGMIVAVPTYTMMRLFFKEFYEEYKAHFTIW
jgi:predicted PurR-regulated permease PerM